MFLSTPSLNVTEDRNLRPEESALQAGVFFSETSNDDTKSQAISGSFSASSLQLGAGINRHQLQLFLCLPAL